MKKRLLTLTLVVTLGLATACGSASTSNEANTAAVMEENNNAQEATGAQEVVGEQQTVVGVVEEIKDFMFLISPEGGDGFYSFPTAEEGGVDITGIKVGDKVIVTYKGVLSEVDPFEGEVIAVEKAVE